MTKTTSTNLGRGDTDFAPIEDVIVAISRGEMVIMVDDEDRENEGDQIGRAHV